MLLVSSEAMPHLVTAVRQALAREAAIAALPEDAWPDDYSGNDAPLFEMGLKALTLAQRRGADQVDLAGKARAFLTALLPGYVRQNASNLSDREVEALRKVYGQAPVRYAGEFPTR